MVLGEMLTEISTLGCILHY